MQLFFGVDLIALYSYRLERRLEMYEKDREEQRLRMQKRQERQIREHQDQVRLQRVRVLSLFVLV